MRYKMVPWGGYYAKREKERARESDFRQINSFIYIIYLSYLPACIDCFSSNQTCDLATMMDVDIISKVACQSQSIRMHDKRATRIKLKFIPHTCSPSSKVYFVILYL